MVNVLLLQGGTVIRMILPYCHAPAPKLAALMGNPIAILHMTIIHGAGRQVIPTEECVMEVSMVGRAAMLMWIALATYVTKDIMSSVFSSIQIMSVPLVLRSGFGDPVAEEYVRPEGDVGCRVAEVVLRIVQD